MRTLVLGLAAPITSLDPLYHNLNRNNGLLKHVFESLVATDERMRPRPGLAESWTALDDTTWKFILRTGVRWHDGAAFTADDVITTLQRAPTVSNSPASFAMLVKPIVGMTATGPHTLVLRTAAPHPGLPRDLTHLHIISRAVGEAAETDDYNSGKAMVGTGPFTFVEHRPDELVVLARNESYWGAPPAWAVARFRMINEDAARIAALLAGEAHVIENVPTGDVGRLSAMPSLAVTSVLSSRLIYLQVDSGREHDSPFVRRHDGGPLKANPLRDLRVRRAISWAIDRKAIAERVMHGQAVPAAQFLPDEFVGTSHRLQPDAFDPDGARRLLAEAGYVDGFQLTLHTPNNRYVNDERVARAVARDLARIGLDITVEATPAAAFFARGARLEFSFLLSGWGSETGDALSPLRALVGTFDEGRGLGAGNWGRYSDPALDAMILAARGELDEARRGRLLAAASERAMAGLGVIPLHYERVVWAMTRDVTYAARADQYTLAYDVMPAL